MLNLCPPIGYLQIAADHCPKAVSTYLFLWKNQNENSFFSVSKENARVQFLSLTKFKNDLNLLLKEGLISYQEKNGNFFIELTAWDEDFEEDEVC